MYTEVFLSSSALAHAPAATAAMIDNFHVPSHALDPCSPLHLFLSTALTSLSNTLSSALPALTSPSSLSSLLTQLSYCSHSFARHGLDFREVLDLRQRVELRIGRITVAEWELAGRKWEKEWRDGWESSGAALSTIAAKARRSGRTPIADWLVVPEGLAALLSTPLPDPPSTLTAPSHQAWHHQPPAALSLLPPLARFLNAHATSLNSLRLLPPLSLYPSLRAAQARELDRATQVLAAFTDAWLTSFNATPLPRPTAVFPSQERGNGKGDDDQLLLTEEEKQLLRERDDEKRLVTAAIAWFGRAIVPWCEGALERGVEDGVLGAARRAERLLARIEGREWVDPEVGAQDGVEPNGESAAGAELPVVLEVPPEPLDPPPPASSTRTNGITSLDFSGPSSIDVDTSQPPIEDADMAPYLVGEIAPPRPASADRASKVVEGMLSREGGGQGEDEDEDEGVNGAKEEETEEEGQ
ncbi:SPOSA6832_04835, partial [Sporobolomyces salmonicolor]